VTSIPASRRPRPFGGGELREQGRAEGVLGADRHSQQEPHHHQLPRLGDHRLQQAEHDERGDVDREQGAAADPVREPPHDRRAEEDADQRRRRDEPAPHRRQTEVRRDQRQDHGDDAEVEAVESLADRRRCGHPPQHAHVAPRHEARH
jgi:hypothetical protein